MKWQELEDHVKKIASFKWGIDACSETINGVRVDCVLKIEDDHWILIETTKERTLTKLRTDLAKFATVRLYLFSQSVYAECYFVCQEDPPPSLRDSGSGQKVRVLSVREFNSLFFNFESYALARSQQRFGSAVDPESGEKDPREYVPVKYVGVSTESMLGLEQLAEALWSGKRIVLLGNYGTGKSRCTQELFALLRQHPGRPSIFYPIAIDLRQHWGAKNAYEILQRHFADLGLSELTDKSIQLIDKNVMCFLLDGFDEIGSQAWSDNPNRLQAIRAQSLAGVKDLLSRTKGGIIITGREHYFNSDQEMYQCLGLQSSDTLVVRCSDEFTDSEMHQYLNPLSPGISLPSWIPRRPLVCQIMVGMGEETLTALSRGDSSETVFWETLITALCERESRIYGALDPMSIRRVLRRLARDTRCQPRNIGPISTTAINSAFEAVTGYPPVEESAVILQRLPALGRLGSESADRQFVDEYILDGLRAEDVIALAEMDSSNIFNRNWSNPLQRFGLTLLVEYIHTSPAITHLFKLMRQAAARQNGTLAGDILAAMLMASSEPLDFSSLSINDAHISFLDLSRVTVKCLTFNQCIIGEMDISECSVSKVSFHDCIIQQLVGVSAAQGLPEWIKNCSIEQYEAVTTVSRIKRASLSNEQRIFVTLIKKLFFQPGTGRKEEALLRGLGAAGDRKTADHILSALLSQDVLTRFKGNEGWVYSPNRKYARRMGQILTELTLSQDTFWTSLG